MDGANEGESGAAALLINDSLRREKAATTTPKANGTSIKDVLAGKRQTNADKGGGRGLESLESTI